MRVIDIKGKRGCLQVSADDSLSIVTHHGHLETPIRDIDGIIHYTPNVDIPVYLRDTFKQELERQNFDGPYSNDLLRSDMVSERLKDTLTTMNDVFGRGRIAGIFYKSKDIRNGRGRVKVKLQHGDEIVTFRVMNGKLAFRGKERTVGHAGGSTVHSMRNKSLSSESP